MDRFVSNTTLRLDSKGRVSIPASFRSVLSRDGFDGLYCYPALDRPAIDAGGNALMSEIEALIGRYTPFSEEREHFAMALYGTSETLKVDGEGRVMLSDSLKRHAGITDQAAFIGLGHKFQIWEPSRFQSELAEATQKVRALKAQLGSSMAAHNAQVVAPGARE
jgi:MraZ protein